MRARLLPMWPALSELWPFMHPGMVADLSAAEWRVYLNALEDRAAEARRTQ